MNYDIVVIGGGPAGASFARIIDSKYKVLVIDKRNLNEEKDYIRAKCCGGLLAPQAQKVLAQMHLGLPKEMLVEPQVFSVKAIDFKSKIQKFYQRNYININREKFDRWMFSLIPKNIDVITKCILKDIRKNKSNIEVELFYNGKLQNIKTKILIGADGSNSKVRNEIYKEDKIEKYISIQNCYKTKTKMPYFVSVFDNEISDFYSWVIQKEDGLFIGTAIKDSKTCHQKYDLLIKKLKNQGFDIGKCIKKEGTCILRPMKNKDIFLGRENIFLIGEAAGFISPSSAEGISYALRSGYLLAESINKSLSNHKIKYKKNTLKLRTEIRIKKIKAKIMYNDFLRKWIMKSGVLSYKDYR